MKKFFKISGIILLCLFVIALIIPMLFKSKIIEALKTSLNKDITGHIEFQDASVSLVKHFPKLTLSVNNLICNSYVNQDTSLLFQASEIQLGFNLWTLITEKNKLVITKFAISKPIINLIEYDSLVVNSNIMKSSTQDSSSSTNSMALDVESYEITDGLIQYTSQLSGSSLEIHHLNHSGSLYNSNEIIKIKTNTSIQQINFAKNNISLIKSLQLLSNLDFEYHKTEHKISLNQCELNLNHLKLECLGTLASIGDSTIMDLRFKSPGNKFSDIFSLMPDAYIKDYSSIKSDGTFQLDAQINGIYSSKYRIYPSWNLACKIENGYLRYPGKSIELEQFNLDLVSQNIQPDLKHSEINLKTFSFQLNKQGFGGNLKLSGLGADWLAEGKLNGILNLADINSFYPLNQNTKISGMIKPDVAFRFTRDQIQEKQYDQIICNGTLTANSINYQTSGQPDISVPHAELKLNSKSLDINDVALKFGESDMNIQGAIEEPLNFISKDKQVNGHLQATGSLLNLKEWMKPDSATKKVHLNKTNTKVPDAISKLNLFIDCNVARMMYSDYEITDSKASGIILGNSIIINQCTTNINQNQINGTGKFNGIYGYMMNDQVLSGDLQILSKQFDADKFMAKSTVNNSKAQAAQSQVFFVPENIEINVGFKSNAVVYKPLTLSNAAGKLNIGKNEIQFEDMNAEIAGGRIGLKGIYNTANHEKPTFNFKFDIQKLQFSDALNSFASLKKIAPLLQYIQGSFNTNLIFEGILDKNMFPILDEMSINGLFETLQGSIQGFKPLDALADKLKMNSLKKLNIGNTKNWVNIKNGIVGIKDFNKKIDDIDINVNGNHKIAGPMQYQFIIKIPKAKVAGFASSLKLDHAMDQLNNLLNKTGLGGSIINNINLLVTMSGSATQPSFGFKLLDDKGEVSSEQDQLKDAVKSKITDSINSRVEAEKTKATAELNKIQDSISKAAGKKADELKNQVLDKAAKEAGKSIDTSISNKAKETLDSLSKKVLNQDAKKEADQIKDKLNEWNPFKKDKK